MEEEGVGRGEEGRRGTRGGGSRERMGEEIEGRGRGG